MDAAAMQLGVLADTPKNSILPASSRTSYRCGYMWSFFGWGWERQVGRRGVQSRLKRTSLISRKSSYLDTLSSSPKPKPQKPCSNRISDSIWTALAVGVGGPLRYGWVYLCCAESLCLRNLHLAMSNEVPSGEPWMNRDFSLAIVHEQTRIRCRSDRCCV